MPRYSLNITISASRLSEPPPLEIRDPGKDPVHEAIDFAKGLVTRASPSFFPRVSLWVRTGDFVGGAVELGEDVRELFDVGALDLHRFAERHPVRALGERQ